MSLHLDCSTQLWAANARQRVRPKAEASASRRRTKSNEPEVGLSALRSCFFSLGDGFSSRQAPASSAQLDPVLDEMPTSSLDHAGGDRQPHLQILIIVQVGSVTEQVVTAAIDGFTRLTVQLAQCGATPDATSDRRALPAQDSQQPLADPIFSLTAFLIVERGRGGPKIFRDVDQIQHHGHGYDVFLRHLRQNFQLGCRPPALPMAFHETGRASAPPRRPAR